MFVQFWIIFKNLDIRGLKRIIDPINIYFGLGWKQYIRMGILDSHVKKEDKLDVP